MLWPGGCQRDEITLTCYWELGANFQQAPCHVTRLLNMERNLCPRHCPQVGLGPLSVIPRDGPLWHHRKGAHSPLPPLQPRLSFVTRVKDQLIRAIRADLKADQTGWKLFLVSLADFGHGFQRVLFVLPVFLGHPSFLLHAWSAFRCFFLVCLFGLPVWSSFLVLLFGLPVWSSFLVLLFGLP